jgi:hypothetical protein
VFDKAIKALTGQIGRWSSNGRSVVADTSFYIERPQKLEVTDFGRCSTSGSRPSMYLCRSSSWTSLTD